MDRLLALVVGTMILAGCSAAAAPSVAPVTPAPTASPDSMPPTTPMPRPSTTDLVCTAADYEATGLDPAMTLAGTPFRFQWQTLSPRDGSLGGWSDSVPGPTGRFVSGEAPVVVAPVRTVVRLEPARTVTFRGGWMELYELDADDQVIDPEGPPVERAELRVVDGDLEVPMPADAGHWLLNIYGRWLTDCAEGDGYVDLLLITEARGEVTLAPVEIRRIADRPAADDCTAADWAAPGLDPAMTLAGTPITYQPQTGGSRDAGGTMWADSVPGPTVRFSAFRPQVVEADAGSVARLAPKDSITFTGGWLDLYRLGPGDTLSDDAEPVAAIGVGGDAGGLDVPMPTTAGRWLLTVRSDWQTDCAAGTGYVDILLVTS